MKRTFSLLLICMSICISFSCKKGLDGINGKDGKDGTNGKDGSNGKDGKDGKDGKNAEVTSRTFTITNWVYDAEQLGYYATLNVSSFITPEVKNSGIILVYAQFPNQVATNAWNLLPHTFFRTSNYFSYITYAFSPNNTTSITIWWNDSDRTIPIYPFNLNIRVVAIPGSFVTSSRKVDFKDYELVRKTFNLK